MNKILLPANTTNNNKIVFYGHSGRSSGLSTTHNIFQKAL